MPLAKVRDRIVIGLLIGGQHTKGNALMSRALDLARRGDTLAVGVD